MIGPRDRSRQYRSEKLQGQRGPENQRALTIEDLQTDFGNAIRELLHGNLVQTGTVVWAASAPSGYLPADGAAHSRTVFAKLFKEIGTTYGVGDGSTTFNLPTVAAASGLPAYIKT